MLLPVSSTFLSHFAFSQNTNYQFTFPSLPLSLLFSFLSLLSCPFPLPLIPSPSIISFSIFSSSTSLVTSVLSSEWCSEFLFYYIIIATGWQLKTPPMCKTVWLNALRDDIRFFWRDLKCLWLVCLVLMMHAWMNIMLAWVDMMHVWADHLNQKRWCEPWTPRLPTHIIWS